MALESSARVAVSNAVENREDLGRMLGKHVSLLNDSNDTVIVQRPVNACSRRHVVPLARREHPVIHGVCQQAQNDLLLG